MIKFLLPDLNCDCTFAFMEIFSRMGWNSGINENDELWVTVPENELYLYEVLTMDIYSECV